jgi:hypothetical protein
MGSGQKLMYDNMMPGDNSGPGGPDSREPDCPDCVDGIVNRPALRVNGIDYPAIVNQKCDTCDGHGFLEAYDGYYEDNAI